MPESLVENPPPGGAQDDSFLTLGPRKWLETRGLIASVPCIRSRDITLVNDCRLLFYLTRRLHLKNAVGDEDSEALSRGSWFHTRLEALDLTPAGALAFINSKVQERVEEIAGACHALGIGPEKRMQYQESARHDALTTFAWFAAASEFKHPGSSILMDGFPAFLKKFATIATEARLYLKHPDFPATHLCAQPDRILLDETNNVLWLLDAKTTSHSPRLRAETCLIEPQPRHYCFVARHMLPLLIEHYKLPKNVRLGGILHLIVQKPPIEFGQKDRPYTLFAQGVRSKMHGRARLVSGKWWATSRTLGEPLPPFTESRKDYVACDTEQAAFDWLAEACGKQPSKEYAGEPSLDIFIPRCADWFNGRGDYAEQNPARYGADSPVNLSSIQADLLLADNTRYYTDYLKQLRRAYKYATTTADPYDFDATASGMTTYGGKVSSWGEFHTSPVLAWPDIILRQRLIQSPEDSIDPASPSTIVS